MAGQSYERLIRLEDEELESSEDTNACHVSMLPDGNSTTANSITDPFINSTSRHKQTKLDGGNSLPGLQFTINGRHIQMSSEQLKYLSLITLTVQNAALNLTMRAARTQKEQFSTSVAVTLAEFLKLLTCIGLIWYEEVTLSKSINTIKTNIIQNYADTIRVAVPSFVYYIQNNLLYVGSTHLDAATCQVTYQLKILTTAIFSVAMLNKKLSKLQWASLVILFVGVALIETMAVAKNGPIENGITNRSVELDDGQTDSGDLTNLGSIPTTTNDRLEKPLLGFMAILAACCLSGFAGVYFEKILKNTAHVSLWIRNIQLSVVAIPIGLIQVSFLEYDHLTSKGAFHGFTLLTWLCILLQVQGGLLVAVVVKFANNILKGFATSMAIVISTVASMFLFNFDLTPTFIFGASLVIGSVMIYNKQ